MEKLTWMLGVLVWIDARIWKKFPNVLCDVSDVLLWGMSEIVEEWGGKV